MSQQLAVKGGSPQEGKPSELGEQQRGQQVKARPATPSSASSFCLKQH